MAQILEKKSEETKSTLVSEKPGVKAVKQPVTDFKIVGRFIKVTPDKVRLVGKSIISKELEDAITTVTFITKSASVEIISVLKNAQSQLKERDWPKAWVKAVRVDEGPKLKRRRIIHRGRSTTILKRMSHLTIEFTSDGNPKSKIRNFKQIPNSKNKKVQK